MVHTKGLSRSVNKICNTHGIEVHLKGDGTTKNLLVAPKDKHITTQKIEVIYRYKSIMVRNDEEYTGECRSMRLQ